MLKSQYTEKQVAWVKEQMSKSRNRTPKGKMRTRKIMSKYHSTFGELRTKSALTSLIHKIRVEAGTARTYPLQKPKRKYAKQVVQPQGVQNGTLASLDAYLDKLITKVNIVRELTR